MIKGINTLFSFIACRISLRSFPFLFYGSDRVSTLSDKKLSHKVGEDHLFFFLFVTNITFFEEYDTRIKLHRSKENRKQSTGSFKKRKNKQTKKRFFETHSYKRNQCF